MKKIIQTDRAPAAIGAYSQAVRVGDAVYVSGQIPLDPETMQVVEGGFVAQTHRVLQNLLAIAEAVDVTLDSAVKLNVYVTDLANFAELNTVMAEYVNQPYPARAAIEVSALPKGVMVEIDAVLYVG